ncbi:hypothetical protein V2E39_21455, partial [Chryseobacterium arthrosphaerae]
MSQNFKHLYLKALLPFERINESSVFIPFSGENNKYLGFWKKNIDKDGLEEQFKKYCEAVNINEDDVTLMISNDFKDNN